MKILNFKLIDECLYDMPTEINYLIAEFTHCCIDKYCNICSLNNKENKLGKKK
jgi:hypothetical protein